MGDPGPDPGPGADPVPDLGADPVPDLGSEPGTGPAAGSSGGHRHNPVPALLTSLLSEGIDPGYAEAAARRAEEVRRAEAARATSAATRSAEGSAGGAGTGTASPPPRRHRWRPMGYAAAGVLVVGLVFGVAARATQQSAPSAEKARQSLLDDVHAAQAKETQLAASISALNSAIRSEQAALGATGPLASLSALEVAGGLTPVIGPGLQVVIDEGNTASGAGVILDSDIQLLVNSLWASGAEAISVGGVRLRTTSAIRQAGGAILVDNQPVFWPITIQAVGDPNTIHVAFVQTDGFARFSAFASLYGIRFDLSAATALTLPPAAAPDGHYASVPPSSAPTTPMGTVGTAGTVVATTMTPR